MCHWLRKATEACRGDRKAAGDDGVVDVPHRTVMVAMALGMLVGAMAAPAEPNAAAGSISLSRSTPMVQPAEPDHRAGAPDDGNPAF